MNTPFCCGWLLVCFSVTAFSQIDYTANDTVPTYEGVFRPGANMGFYNGWTDAQLADIAAGNQDLGIDGAGVRAFRPLLPEYFLEDWGYDIRVPTFQHYVDLDIDKNTALIGFPNQQHRDPSWYCPWGQSQLFANMYLPIWDDGANGTPVNDQNHYALYLYKMVNEYKDFVKFWEVWNEPDQDYGGNGWKPIGWAGNWWENTPSPCEYGLMAPVYHYIRMLRISYEVIKSVDPEAYISIGGLGYPAFLDVILRHTDNPNAGLVNDQYPNLGGAYFDAMAFHSYPHLDGSLRYWNEDINNWSWKRHSDAAAEGISRLQGEFQVVLDNYWYDGDSLPEKIWLITEGNLPGQSVGDYIGTSETQRNFILKAMVECQTNNIVQYDMYIMSDQSYAWGATQAFEMMGLYQYLSATPTYNQVKNEVGIAYTTWTDEMFGKKYAADQTALLDLPPEAKGAAFLDEMTGEHTYVLWSKTYQDGSEQSFHIYHLPDTLDLEEVRIRYWNHSETNYEEIVPATFVKLTGAPIFISEISETSDSTEFKKETPSYKTTCFPNPFKDVLNIQLELPESTIIQANLLDMQGKPIAEILSEQTIKKGQHQFAFDGNQLGAGLYLVQFITPKKVWQEKVVYSPYGNFNTQWMK